MNSIFRLGVVLLAAITADLGSAAETFQIEETTIAKVEQAFRDRSLTCHQLVQAYLDRIAAQDHAGPSINAILTLNPKAIADADALDAKPGPAGPLHCVPLVLKDNYNTGDLPTTGGSASLAGAQPTSDAFVVAKLRKAGAIILGKTNMHEFAQGGTTVSSLGGQTLNPYDLSRTPGGSSGGTGAAVAANFALAGTGTDTVNSIRSPASANALVGIRPTRGLLSRAGIVPMSETQDAAGPIARTVTDATRLLEVMAGYDSADPVTAWSVGNTPSSYSAFLTQASLPSLRIGLLKTMLGDKPEHQEVNAAMADAVTALQKAGGIIVEIDEPALAADKLIADDDVQKYEFKKLISSYLATVPNAPVKSLDDIIASGKFHKPSLEKFFTNARAYENGTEEADYQTRLLRHARVRQIVVSLMADHRLDALIYPLQKRLVVPITEPSQIDRNGILAAVTGFPAITVPVGFSKPSNSAPIGIPIGMDILGRPWSEGHLIQIAYVFEQATQIRKPPRIAPR
jgi:Asp-tRNA(Asn)/Glu-tRNA(Gln) amidotransferase A subunit family amidase